MLQAAKRMREAIARGEEAERRLRRFLQAIHGSKAPTLLRYGIQPHRERRRPAEEPEAAAPDAPGASAAAGDFQPNGSTISTPAFSKSRRFLVTTAIP
jgi:hypothetical protein